MASSDGPEGVIEQSHVAWDAFLKGDPEPGKALFSRGDDVSLGNPYGPFAVGWKDVEQTMERAAALYRDGEAVGFDSVALYASADLACLVEVERYRGKVGGAEEAASIALRVTSVLRREDGGWKIVHRHADPITSPRTAESVIQP
jgi:ketosteroid isomerase-like protein